MATHALALPAPHQNDADRSPSSSTLPDPGCLDPSHLGPLPQIPLIPEALRRQHHVFIPADHRFKAAARFLQALWREDRDLPIGTLGEPPGPRRKLGSLISSKAGELGGNFIDPEILPVVNRALVYRELGAVYELDRLKLNLLSSQPLVFNAFGHLARDLAFATRFVDALLPGLMAEVTHVLFEHSPGRGDPRFTQDGTAWDLAIRGRSATGQRVFIGVEAKYSEGCQEPLPRFSGRCAEIAPTAGLFVDPADPRLFRNPVQQLLRQHCLGATLLDADLADTAMQLLIAPAHNHLVTAAAASYARLLSDPVQGRIPFIYLTLEQVFAALATAGRPDTARALHRRYTDLWLIDGELGLEEAPAPASAAPAAAAPTPAVINHPEAPSPTAGSSLRPTATQRTKRSAKARSAATAA
ncbi:PGN_0703 family putative restriction endonuclease [Methylobacterium iners]|uniref:PD-(D/E)XK nuclease-like domain-containing protein n=1 Tax=Methylobacterium iners TaxID=418707 RepID=A0ABQ4S5D0_9HYPH|nr:hypothetical protein [Methylobacterium iners]GJD97693.1 hypothetical protein OCOJLMKI_4926 [Methylobacterium iners]